MERPNWKVDNDNIRGLMAANKLTQMSLCKEIGISDVSLRSKLSGRTDWSCSEIIRLCMIFNKMPSDFFVSESDEKVVIT